MTELKAVYKSITCENTAFLKKRNAWIIVKNSYSKINNSLSRYSDAKKLKKEKTEALAHEHTCACVLDPPAQRHN